MCVFGGGLVFFICFCCVCGGCVVFVVLVFWFCLFVELAKCLGGLFIWFVASLFSMRIKETTVVFASGVLFFCYFCCAFGWVGFFVG